MQTSRAQSETVGALLLVGVVTLSVSTYAAVFFSDVADGPDAPEVQIEGAVTTTEVTLWHEAGDPLTESDLAVQFRANGTEWTNVTWVSGSVAGTDDGRFAEGETWTWDDGTVGAGARVEWRLVDRASQSVVFEQRTTVGGGGGGPADSPPTATFDVTPTTVGTGEPVAVDASDSEDPDGGSLTYQWDFDDGAGAVGPTSQHSYTDDGSYDVTLTVTDDEGFTASTTRTVTVTNRAPSASFTLDPSLAQVSEPVTVDATATDPDGTVTDYQWDFGDGTTATGETASHPYDSPGSYTVTLTVTDDDGATATATETVQVARAPDDDPPSVTVDRPTGGEVLRGGESYTIRWSATDGDAVDSVALAYSADGGSSWSTIASGLSNTGSYDWNVPTDDTTQAKVRVNASDAAGNVASDESGVFSVDSSPPEVKKFDVSSPGNSGNVKVAWKVTDNLELKNVSIRLEQNGGTVVEATTTVSGTSASETKQFKEVDGREYTVVLVVHDEAGRERERSTTVTVGKSAPGGGNDPPDCPGNSCK